MAQLERVPRIFSTKNDIYRRPAIIIVPANLVHAWERATQSLIGGTGLNLTNFHSRRDLTRNQLNYSSDNPERGTTIHLISYSTYRVRYRNPDHLLDCQCRVGILDVSHLAKSLATQTFESLMKIDVPCRIQLTGTTMHHIVGDWVVQTEWLFAQVTDENELKHHSPVPLH